MKSSFKYGVCLSLIFLAVSLYQQNGGGIFFKWSSLEARVPEKSDGPDLNTVIFNKANPSIRAIMAVQKRYTDSPMAQPGIVGTAMGLWGKSIVSRQ